MADRTTVLHLIDTGGPGGAETVFKSLVTGLPATRWRSIPVVPNRDWLHDALGRAGIDPVLLPSAHVGGGRHLLDLLSLIRKHRVHLVHAHLLGASVYGSLAAWCARIPCVCTFHGLTDIPSSGSLLPLKWRILSRRRNRIVFVSASLRNDVLKRHHLPESRIRVVHNGIDPGPVSPRGDERREMGVDQDDFLVVAVGNLRPAKDYPTLLRSIAALSARGAPAKLVVIGEGEGTLLGDLLRLRDELGLETVVHFTGFRDDVPRLVAASDIVVSSSEREGFSLSTVEALWLGKPVVATRSGGPEEIVRHEETGLLAPVRDPSSLADAMFRLWKAPAAAAAMGEAGRADVRERFSMERMLTLYEEIYFELLGRPRASERYSRMCRSTQLLES